MRDITGTTRLFGILADPVAHVKTPQGLNALMRARCIDGVMVPMHVTEAGLEAFVAGLRGLHNFGGFIVTVPFKSRMVALCDKVSDAALSIGAVNAVRREADGRLVADMLDGHGFVAGLRDAGISPAGHAVFLAGAGGAANAIAFALAEARIARLTIHNRTAARTAELAARLHGAFPHLPVAAGTADPSGHTLVVNATSLGLRAHDPLPLDTHALTPGMTVAEVVMQPEVTPLLAHAAARGCRVQPGLPMLTGQLELMARFLGMA